MNRSDYVLKMNDLLSNSSKFVSITDDCYKLCQRLENRLNSTLLSLFKAGKLDKATYDSLHSSGSYPGKLYGLPKTHKTGVPLRPILSAVTCHNYNLAKFLVPILSPLATSQYTVSDVFSFSDELRLRSDSTRTHMVSLDIESLFTNVPVAETIDIIISSLFTSDNMLVHGFSKTEFTNLLKLAVEDSYFSFDHKLFKQIDGMAMGSPLGPIFANIFLSYHETSWLRSCPVTPFLYKRYVDDTLWLLPADSSIDTLMTYMNSRHPNMKFTYETETNNCIPFIGLTISHSDNNNSHSYSTTVYRKPTFTGLFTNFNSFTCISYRLSVLRCLVFRALRLCSTADFFLAELNAIKAFLMRNAYPAKIIDSVIRTTLAKLANPSVKFGPTKERLFVGLPFWGKSSDSLRRSLKTIVRKFLPHRDLIVYFKPGRRVANFFHNKDFTPTGLRSRVVYEFTCASCHASYVGQTTRHLKHRVAEHLGVSHLTGRPMRSPPHSSIRDHCCQCQGADCSIKDFKILASASSSLELLIKERLLIERRHPSLNGNSGALELLLF